MKVLLLGGTGAMGAHLCKVLTENGDNRVYVTTRSTRNNSDNVHYLIGNAHDNSFLNGLLSDKGWDAIVDFMSYTTAEFSNRVDLLLGATRQYLFLSSARVYANTQTPIREDSPRLLDVCSDSNYLSTDEYALAKARQENILRMNKKLNWTIIRPYITFSEIRLQLSPSEKEYWLYDALNGKSVFFSRDLADRYTTVTYGFDVARGIASLMGKEDALGEAFHITASESYRWGDILEHYLNVIEGKTGRRPVVRMLDRWAPFIGGNIDQVRWDRLYDRRFDNSKINKFIDTDSFNKTLPSLEKCLSSFIDNPKFNTIDWRAEANKDKLTGDWTCIRGINGMKQRIKYLLIRTGMLD